MKFFWTLLMAAIVLSVSSCEAKKEPGKKEVQTKAPAGYAGYIVNFKPNDSPDLVPPKTLILLPSPADGQNMFCLDVIAKKVDPISGVAFDLNFDPAGVSYQSYKPGVLFEEKGKPVYEIAMKTDQKGKLGVKISSESGPGGTSGSGKLVTLCFKALQPGRVDLLFENGELLDLKKKKVTEVTWVGGLLWVLEAT
jgi:hypothetical protein